VGRRRPAYARLTPGRAGLRVRLRHGRETRRGRHRGRGGVELRRGLPVPGGGHGQAVGPVGRRVGSDLGFPASIPPNNATLLRPLEPSRVADVRARLDELFLSYASGSGAPLWQAATPSILTVTTTRAARS
jgi:hypothetical protein